MIKGINHIGLAVKSIDETLQFLKEAYGAEELERHSFPEIGQVSSLVRIGKDHFELMEPFGAGVVAKFLEEKGEGFHHISLLSDNLQEDCEHLEKQGVKIIGKTLEGPFKVAFTHPKTTRGIIYEIAEY
jgi:methylmalonyl-CoA/ethylmalonyl-CoA epimerase